MSDGPPTVSREEAQKLIADGAQLVDVRADSMIFTERRPGVETLRSWTGVKIETRNFAKDKKFTRKEYSYSSFSRSFTLPEEVNKEKIEARYEDGVLKLSLPRKEEAKKPAAKQIAVK